MYKEAQIHGPVCLAIDIEALSIPGRESDASKDLDALVNVFQKKTGCSILWQGDLLGYDNRTQMPRIPASAASAALGSLPPEIFGAGMFPGLPGGTISSDAAGGGAIPFSGAGHRLGADDSGLGASESRYGSSSSATPFSGAGDRLGRK